MQTCSEDSETVNSQPDPKLTWRSQLIKPLRSIWSNLSQVGNLLKHLEEDQPDRW